ncbi:MAG: tRNA (adenosine(37)-N6)-dimethylallyltransferase MiaA [Acidobacteria bacterium]|nr:tRNA (adenosine(37)-N6)-dimethylallyltransferase MiaA [Acidobacteriota bacterium]
MAEELIRIVVIVGPTAAGKSDLALAIARRFGGEIVGADSAQVYRGLDAATGKPPRADREAIPHHLIDVADPAVDFSAGDYARLAQDAIARVAAGGRPAVVVGGTGLYVRALLRGLTDLPRRDASARAALKAWAGRRDEGALHRMLQALDPAAARALPGKDTQRIVRAIEVVLSTGRPYSALVAAQPFAGDRYDAIKVGITAPREVLSRRIDGRVDAFFGEGDLVAEVRGLLASGVPAAANALKALGYREVMAHLRGGGDLPATMALVKRNTRRYAKRQLTWFRREPDVIWYEFRERPEERFAEIVDAIALRMEAPGESHDGHR